MVPLVRDVIGEDIPANHDQFGLIVISSVVSKKSNHPYRVTLAMISGSDHQSISSVPTLIPVVVL